MVLFAAVYVILPKQNYYTPSIHTILLTIPYGMDAGMFFAPITTLSLSKLKDKTNLGTSLLHYPRFVGGSFGTALATNTLEKKITMHYKEISALQGKNLLYAKLFLKKWLVWLSKIFPSDATIKKAKALLGYATQYKSFKS